MIYKSLFHCFIGDPSSLCFSVPQPNELVDGYFETVFTSLFFFSLTYYYFYSSILTSILILYQGTDFASGSFHFYMIRQGGIYFGVVWIPYLAFHIISNHFSTSNSQSLRSFSSSSHFSAVSLSYRFVKYYFASLGQILRVFVLLSILYALSSVSFASLKLISFASDHFLEDLYNGEYAFHVMFFIL